MNFKKLLLESINASILGGKAIMDIYETEFEVEFKKDNSPLTIADKKCNDIIESSLKFTNIPILSEEGRHKSFQERKKWDYLWLIDPLDGTKEFIKKNGQFTVNIALIKDGVPIMGVVYVPVKKKLYFSLEGIGSFKTNVDHLVDNLEDLIYNSVSLPIASIRDSYVIVGSLSHMSKETEIFIEEKRREHDNIQVMTIGSSLKLCMVAEGKADTYPRYAPTMEWDTGAGHAIVKMAGFSVKQYNTDIEVTYNKKNLLNPWFLVE
tara:strand:- start:984 stop:1775 length:792 start_codon:yes stop_codon:yes gene_type:complete